MYPSPLTFDRGEVCRSLIAQKIAKSKPSREMLRNFDLLFNKRYSKTTLLFVLPPTLGTLIRHTHVKISLC